MKQRPPTRAERMLTEASKHLTIGDLEWLAGKLMVVSSKLRKDRMGPGDAHEMRHLLAALEAGNSDPCGASGDHCHLDPEPPAHFGGFDLHEGLH